MMIKAFDRVENIVGKGENAGCHNFLLFPQLMFSKGFLFGSLKSGVTGDQSFKHGGSFGIGQRAINPMQRPKNGLSA